MEDLIFMGLKLYMEILNGELIEFKTINNKSELKLMMHARHKYFFDLK